MTFLDLPNPNVQKFRKALARPESWRSVGGCSPQGLVGGGSPREGDMGPKYSERKVFILTHFGCSRHSWDSLGLSWSSL